MTPEQLLAALTDEERAAVEAARQGDPAQARDVLRVILERAAQRLGVHSSVVYKLRDRLAPARPTKKALAPTELARSLPYPLGWKLAGILRDRAMIGEGQPAPQLAYDIAALTSATLRFVVATLVQAYVQGGGSNPETNRTIIRTLAENPTDGSWRDLARGMLKVLVQNGQKLPPFAEGFREAMAGQKIAPERRVPGVSSASKDLVDVDHLVDFRNAVAHGQRITPAHASLAVDVLVDVLGRFEGLTRHQLVVRTGDRGVGLEAEVPTQLASVDPALPEGEPCLVPREGEGPFLSLSPLLRWRASTGEVTIDELYFVNAATHDRMSYVAFRVSEAIDGWAVGGHEPFRELLRKIPAPPIPPDPRLDFTALAAESARFFVGREGVLEAIDRVVRERSTTYAVVRALPGMGKTSLLSRYLLTHPPVRAGEARPGDRFVYHFCSSIDGRNSPVVALRSLIAQICDAVDIDAQKRAQHLSLDLKDLRDSKLPGLLLMASQRLGEGERLVIVIDALDEGFGGGEDPVASALPAVLPPNVVAIVSYRVDASGHNARVEHAMRHIAPAAMQVVEGADPLGGLTRDNVAEYLAHVRQRALDAEGPLDAFASPAVVVDAVYTAALTRGGGADPFFLRFIAQGVDTETIDLDRPETIPTSLDDAFEDTWLALPTDGEYLVQRMLLYLGILREPATDDLMSELLTRDRPDLPRVFIVDVAGARVHAGKLLIHDERGRFALFHDRFRRFLVGDQPDPLDLVLDDDEDADAA